MCAELMHVALVGAEDLQARSMMETLREGGFGPAQILPLSSRLGALELSILEDDSAEVFLPLDEAVLEPAQIIALFSSDAAARAAVIGWARAGGKLLLDLAPEAGQGDPWLDPLATREAPGAEGAFRVPEAGALYFSKILSLLGKYAPGMVSVQYLHPASRFGEEGVLELHQQAANLLTFKPLPEGILGGQVAFNCLPLPEDAGSAAFADQVRNLTGLAGAALSCVSLQSPAFHGAALSAILSAPIGAREFKAFSKRLGAAPTFGTWSKKHWPSSAEVAGMDKPLVRASLLESGAIWLWFVFDNARAGQGALAGRWITGTNPR